MSRDHQHAARRIRRQRTSGCRCGLLRRHPRGAYAHDHRADHYQKGLHESPGLRWKKLTLRETIRAAPRLRSTLPTLVGGWCDAQNLDMKKVLSAAAWIAIACLGAGSLAWLALSRGETVNAAWLITAAVCTFAFGYRFYSKFIAARVFALDARRATPAVRLEDGRDFVPTNRWIVFGHHFAAIAGPGPLVGPTLAAQFGFLPGALWIIVGVALGGAVQDFVILCASVRRDGKSLGQMAKEEIGPVAGFTALIAVMGIMIVLIAVLALVVVNALKASPWGVVTLGLTIPTALLMGVYLRWVRPHRVLEASAIGIVLLLLSLFAGRWVAANPALAPTFTLSGKTLALLIMGYSFFASVLPVWLLLAPRDYLSAFVKIGVVLALALGIVIVLPPLQMP